MKETNVVVVVKKKEPGLLALTGGDAKSLVPVFGGMRVIDFYVAPFIGSSRGSVHVLAEKGMHAVKDHLLFTYPSGRMRIMTDDDLSAALVALGSQRGNVLLLRADGMLFADWQAVEEQLAALSPGIYTLNLGGGTIGFFLSRTRVPPELLDNGPIADADRLWETLAGRLGRDASAPVLSVDGVYHPLATVWDYFRTHMRILDDLERYLARFVLLWGDGFQRGTKNAASSQIAKTGLVRDSYVPHSCTIQGAVVHTVLFPHVRVARKARVENSVILGQNHLAEGSTVQNAVLCGSPSKVSPTVGEGAVIGGVEQSGENEDHPEALHGGITLIGGNVEVPRSCRIAGNCYIGPGVERSLLRSRRLVRSGSSIEEGA